MFKKHIFIVMMTVSTGLLFFMFSTVSVNSQPVIPMGCPGSTLQGPPSADFNIENCPPAPGTTSGGGSGNTPRPSGGGSQCGGDGREVGVAINIGCKGEGNPIVDMTFAVIRILSIGVGVAVVASVVFAGIQYTSSSGDPQAVAKAKERIISTVGALILYFFIFAILNWLVPNGIL